LNEGLNDALIESLQAQFNAAADAERAVAQQAYLKSSMPHYGIMAPALHRICRDTFKAEALDAGALNAQEWQATVLGLWRGAQFREERYAALELLGFKPYRKYFGPELLDTLDELIVSGAWWDTVDHIAINFVGHLLAEHPREIQPILERWARDENIWRRRSAILAQLKFKARTDQPLLWRLLQPSLEDSLPNKEFFLRKAIGWALRELSKTDPAAVLDYVASNRERLSGLSKREGLKVLIKQGTVKKNDPRFQ